MSSCRSPGYPWPGSPTTWPGGRKRATSSSQKKYLFVGLLVGAFQVAVLIMAGIFVGFGESPFAKNIPGMLTNFSYLASTLIGMEFTRAYVVKSLDRRKLPLAIGFLVVMYAVLLIPPARYASLGDTEVTMRFLGRFIMPSLSDSILTTYLAFLGGPVAALAYRGVQSGFEWYSPVLPDLPWTAYLFIGTIPAMLGYLIVQGLTAPAQQAEAAVTEAAVSRKAASFGRILMASATGCVAVLLAAIILLNIGFMGFRSMVVISPSMSPEINVGDMVITRATDAEDLKVGDIVRYKKSRLNVIHRITDIEQTADGVMLTTKGDANNTVDQPSPKAEDVTGKAVMRLPKLGWVTIWFRQPQPGT